MGFRGEDLHVGRDEAGGERLRLEDPVFVMADVLGLRRRGEDHSWGTGEDTPGLDLVPRTVVSSVEIQFVWRTARDFYDNCVEQLTALINQRFTVLTLRTSVGLSTLTLIGMKTLPAVLTGRITYS